MTQDLGSYQIRKFLENPEMFGNLKASTQPATKNKILTVVVENCENPVVKFSLEEPILLNFVNLSKILCPRLWASHNKFYLDCVFLFRNEGVLLKSVSSLLLALKHAAF